MWRARPPQSAEPESRSIVEGGSFRPASHELKLRRKHHARTARADLSARRQRRAWLRVSVTCLRSRHPEGCRGSARIEQGYRHAVRAASRDLLHVIIQKIAGVQDTLNTDG